jgi:hypothetical protein
LSLPPPNVARLCNRLLTPRHNKAQQNRASRRKLRTKETYKSSRTSPANNLLEFTTTNTPKQKPPTPANATSKKIQTCPSKKEDLQISCQDFDDRGYKWELCRAARIEVEIRVQGLGFSGPHSTAGYRSHLSPLLLTAASRDRYAVKGEVGGREKGGRERATPWCLLQVAKDEDASECAEVRGGERKM